jgi:squalene synthase HpnC/squalene synthase HpnD
MNHGFARELARFGPGRIRHPVSSACARRYCSRLATSHYENFTVASLLLPRRLRPHFHAVYAYCRWADDLGDETGGGARAMELLRWWREELLRSYADGSNHPVMIALAETIRTFRIPAEPFLNLLFAFEQDQLLKRYRTYDQLIGYCRNSANPVGHLVLYLCESFNPENARLADSICTGLQLANFWQDVSRDLDIGRVYLPLEDRQRFGYQEADLETRRYNNAFAQLMRFEVQRARDLFYRGLPLVERMPPEVQSDIQLFIKGGLAILDRIEACRYDVWSARPAIPRWQKATLVGGTILQRAVNLAGNQQMHRPGENGQAIATPAGQLRRSYAFCERLSRKEARNFFHAFRLLPGPQYRAMCALYAFLRRTDDLADDPKPAAARREILRRWREQFEQCLAGLYSHPLHAALHHTVAHYAIPREYLLAVLDGVEMDLDRQRYDSFAELYRYCYCVASAVGLACIHIWGFKGEAAKEHAEKAGIAFQLTNILRDLREDAARGRIYLPQEDLQRWGYDPQQLAGGERNGAYRQLMQFEVGRAREYYDSALPLLSCLPPTGRAVFQTMVRTYRGLLEEIERRDFDVFTERVSLSRWRKLGLVLEALPTRWGWAGVPEPGQDKSRSNLLLSEPAR